MSLVGTRPPTVDEWDKYELHHRARLATKPGLANMVTQVVILSFVCAQEL
jgi:lipopolysaccharide/colanic/teichoic acid biosynthesis glycosyltransferase